METVTPNAAYDAFLPEVNAHEVIDPNPFPQATPLAPESLPLGLDQTNDAPLPWSIGIRGENLPRHSYDGLIGPVGYETE